MASTRTDTANPAWRQLAWTLCNALQLAFTLAWSVFCITLALLMQVLCAGRPHLPLRMASWLWAPSLLCCAGARLRVHGLDRIDTSKPFVLVANHQSIIDICALFRGLPIPLRFVLKQELASMPFLGWYARAMGMVFVDRGRGHRAARSLHDAVAPLRGGASVCAFPEGTRGRGGRVGPFKGGAFQLAIEAGVPVLPVAIQGSGAVLPPGGFRVRPGIIDLHLGVPIATADLDHGDRHALTVRARDAVMALLRHGA